MLKRTLTILLLLSLTLTAISVNAAPVRAAQSIELANADLLPADTSMYLDFRAADLDSTITFIGDTYQKVTGTPMPDIFQQVDQGLTQTLKRDASYAKDIQPWLGDHITIGLSVTDAQVKALSSSTGSVDPSLLIPQFVAIISIKDATAADKFVSDLFAAQGVGTKFTTRKMTVGSDQITILDQPSPCSGPCASIVEAPKFIGIGLTTSVNTMLDALKSNKPKLSSDPNYTKLIGALKPNNLMTLYIAPKLYTYLMGAMVMSQRQLGTQSSQAAAMANSINILQKVLGAINGQAIAIRRDDKVLAIDIAQSLNLSAMSAVYTSLGYPPDLFQSMMPKKLEGKLAGQIPDKAVAVVEASGLASIYSGIKVGLQSAGKFSGGTQLPNMPNYNDIITGITKAEAYLKLAFNLDVQNDILSWMNGEFALYMVFDQNSSLSKLTKGSPYPFDHTLLVDSSDAAKTKAFLTKLNDGLTKNAKITPTSVGDNLYTIAPPNGPELAYGLIGNTFLLTTGSGLDTAKAAIGGDGVITNSDAWKAAQANAVESQAQFWYVDLTQISDLAKVVIPANQLTRQDTKRALALLDLFQSAMISTSTIGSDGMSTATLQLTMK